MTDRTFGLTLLFLVALVAITVAWTVLNIAHREDRAELWRCVEFLQSQPPAPDVYEAMDRCRAVLAHKEMQP